MDSVLEKLFILQDKGYAAFHAGLLPTIDPDTIIGVRMPALRALAKEMVKDGTYKEFVKELPHKYFDENSLHSVIIANIKDPKEAIELMEAFLPYVDNWATCDVLNPKCLKKIHPELLVRIDSWLASDKVYTARHGINMLMGHFLDEEFNPSYLEKVACIESEEYYLNMGRAWYFATALAKQYEDTVKYIEERRLDKWTHNKSIQKAIESNRVTDEHKKYLRTLKIK